MRVRIPSRLTLVTAALLVLLPALALLQYRWLGQLSEAERERMQRNMRHAAAQFREAVDGEIARAFVALQIDSGIVREQAWDRYAERYAAWAGTATHPAIVEGVFVVDAEGPRLRIRRWNGAAGQFEAAQWTGALASAQVHFERELSAHRAGNRLSGGLRPFAGDESLLVAPLLTVQIHLQRHAEAMTGTAARAPLVSAFGHTIVQLNMAFIRRQLLPALAQRHFTLEDGTAYRVAITDAANPAIVVYRSSPDAPTDASRADASEPLLAVPGNPMLFLAREAVPRPADPGGRPAGETRNLVVSVIREAGDAPAAVRTRFFHSDAGRWRLLLQHQQGSLEAAVAGVRRRNLLVSFGILLLMAVSVALLAVTSRRAQRLARQQMEFVAGVSHELRTPVAVIRAAAENLSHGVVGDPDRVRRYGDAIQGEARRLGEMVERVLQFAGLESRRSVPHAPVAVSEVVDAAVAGALGADHRLTLERQIAPDVPPVRGDAEMLRSAVQNLLANAAKYGGEDGWIGVRVYAHGAARAQEVCITVEDHGRGVSSADLPHIFDPFYRGAQATARQIQGSGLGLALVRRIVEAHGGRVTVATRDGAGTAFTIHLPAFRSSGHGAEVLNEAVAG